MVPYRRCWWHARSYVKTPYPWLPLAEVRLFWVRSVDGGGPNWWRDVSQGRLAASKSPIFSIIWSNSWERGNALPWRSSMRGLEVNWHRREVWAGTTLVGWPRVTIYLLWRSIPYSHKSLVPYSRASRLHSWSSGWYAAGAWLYQSPLISPLLTQSGRYSVPLDRDGWSCDHERVWWLGTSAWTIVGSVLRGA